MPQLPERSANSFAISLCFAGFVAAAASAWAQPPQQVVATFANETSGPVSLFWANSRTGQEEFYSTIPKGTAEDRITFTGHTWVIRDSRRREITRATITGSGQQIVARAPVKPVEPPGGEPPGMASSKVTVSNQSDVPMVATVTLPNDDVRQLALVLAGKAVTVDVARGRQLELRGRGGEVLHTFNIVQAEQRVVVGGSRRPPDGVVPEEVRVEPNQPPQVTFTNTRNERLLLVVRGKDGRSIQRILVMPGQTSRLPAEIGSTASVSRIENGGPEKITEMTVSQANTQILLPQPKASPPRQLAVLRLQNRRSQGVRYQITSPTGAVDQAMLAAGANGSLSLAIGTVVQFFDERSTPLNTVTVGPVNEPITFDQPKPVRPDPVPGTSGDGPTYWMGRAQGGSLIYDIKVPKFFVPLIKISTDLGGGKKSVRRINDSEFTLYTQSFTWDGTAAGPRSQAIALKSKNSIDWKSLPGFARPENRAFVEALLDLGVNTYPGTQWHDAMDVSFIEMPDINPPGVSIARNGLGDGAVGGASGPGPEDAASSRHAPTMAAAASADGSLTIGWQRNDEKIFVSTYAGPSFQAARHFELTNALPQFGGFTRDRAGNGYLLTAIHERIRHGAPTKQQRANIVHLHKIDMQTGQSSLLADLNYSSIYPKLEIYNPIDKRPARLVYGGGIVAATFGHGNYDPIGRKMHETGTLIGVTPGGESAYKDGAENHYMDFRMMFDGEKFVRAQEFDQGIAMSTLRRDHSGRWRWSGDKHVVKTPNPGPPWDGSNLVHLTRMGQISTAGDHYLLPYAYDDSGWAIIGDNEEWAGEVSGATLMMVRVPREALETAPNVKVGSWPMVPGVFSQEIARPINPSNNIMRPRMVKLAEDHFVIVYEEWSVGRKHVATFGLIWDGTRAVAGPTRLPNARIQRATDAFLLPTRGRAGFLAGDPDRGHIVLFTLDGNLQLARYELSLPDG